MVFMEKKVEISILCQTYGKLLTEKQFNFIDDYYNNDLSLSEIAENYGITRQAARDNIKKEESKLFEYEEKLGIMKMTIRKEKTIEDVLMQINSIQTDYSDKEIAKILENVKKELKTII